MNEGATSLRDALAEQEADALRFRWLCEHPDWHFIEHLCREFVADSSMEFLRELRRVIDARRSIDLDPLDDHRPAVSQPVTCVKCGGPHARGGYAHPTKCWRCSPTILPRGAQ